MTDRFSDENLDRLRTVGDEPADEVARALLTAYGFDHEVDETEVLGQAVRSVVRGLASQDDAVVRWLSGGPGLPGWAKPHLIAAGQRFFSARPMPIATTLFCAALPATYAAPHGAAVMMATSQMGEREHIARRLAGTGRMIFDAMADTPAGALERGRQGYVTVRGVRLLHAVVRQALLNGKAKPWPAAHGVPVNQEDLLGTLMAFTVSVLKGLDALGMPAGDHEAEAYVHTWCAVGAILGIEESLLPLTSQEAGRLADTIARRQFGPSDPGRRLARDLLCEMRDAMPPFCRPLPAALTWRLVPEVAELLRIPPAGPVWRRLVDAMCELVRRVRDVPVLRRLASGPGAMVGRSVLQMYIDREQGPGGPPYRVDAEVLRNVARRRSGPSERVALDALAHRVVPPIDADDVRIIASEGYPFWEPVEAIVLRNRRITIAYSDLSRQLARLIAGADAGHDANWCTFATWSSRTIGTYLDDIPRRSRDRSSSRAAGLDDADAGDAGPVLDRLALRIMVRSNASSFRILAVANRAVFVDIGLSVAAFLRHFSNRAAASGKQGEAAWSCFWTTVEGQFDEYAMLDPSWLLTPSPDPKNLRLGFRQYFEALRTDDRELRSQHVLAGNLLLAAYEQRRLDGYVWAALALFSDHALRRLIRDETGKVGGARHGPNNLYARAMTSRMTLQLPNEELCVARPVPRPPRADDSWHGLASDADVRLPALQALITRYELSDGRRRRRGARNWTSFDQRMRTIGDLFRSRQRQADLFDPPFDDTQTAELLGW